VNQEQKKSKPCPITLIDPSSKADQEVTETPDEYFDLPVA